MKFSRRQFFRTASGALAFGSSAALLSKAGLAAAEPIKVGNILDKTGGLNIYSSSRSRASRWRSMTLTPPAVSSAVLSS